MFDLPLHQATLTLAVINNMVATAEQAVMLLTSPSMESIQQGQWV